jgi:ABC-2 type transport system permease protein
MRSFFSLRPWIFVIVLSALAMRLWAEERKEGSIELLLTLPITDSAPVVGKYLAALGFLIITLLLTVPTAITVASLGNIDNGEIIGGYLGALLLGGAILALGSFISSLTRNQIVAFLLTVVFSFIAIIISQDYVLAPVGGIVAEAINFVSLSSHYNVLISGLVSAGDIAYFLGWIFFFLFLTIKVLQSRYYKG